jgi:superfamily II DNA or RNA helicase
VIPILSLLGSVEYNKSAGLQVLVLAPTKELADQIFRELNRLAFGRRVQICLLKKSIVAAAISKQVILTLTLLCNASRGYSNYFSRRRAFSTSTRL